MNTSNTGSLKGGATISQIPTITPTYFVNFLSTSIGLSVSSDFGDTTMETYFDTGLTNTIENNILPFAQVVSPDFQLKDYNELVRPGNATPKLTLSIFGKPFLTSFKALLATFFPSLNSNDFGLSNGKRITFPFRWPLFRQLSLTTNKTSHLIKITESELGESAPFRKPQGRTIV